MKSFKKFLIQEASKLDPVGKEDADIDNDGTPNTKTDKYLAKRRKAIGKAIGNGPHDCDCDKDDDKACKDCMDKAERYEAEHEDEGR